MKRGLVFGALVGSCGLLAGCVSESAGYQDVRSIVSQRTGHDVRWQHLETDDSAQKAVKLLLSKPLTSESAVQLALLNNAELQASFEDLGIARGDLVSALALPNPAADGSLRFRKSKTPTIDVSVTEDLSELIFLPLRSGVAEASFDAAKLSCAARAIDVVLEVRRAFYGYLADQQVLDFRRTVLQALEASAVVANDLHQAGNLTDLDLANEQAMYEEARVSFAGAETALSASRERLNALLGLWGAQATWRTESRLGDPPPDLALTGLEARAVERSIDLAMVRYRFTAAARRANLARAQGLLPELKGGITVERDEGQWSYGPLAQVQVPLFYQGQGEVARAKSEMRRQQQLLKARAVQVRTAARVSAARVAAARDRALYIKNVLLPMRERIVEQTQLQYNAMSTSVFRLLLAKREQVETARSYVEALRDYWTARADVEQLRSGRLPAGSALDMTAPQSLRSSAGADAH